MELELDLSQEPAPIQTLRVSPRLVAANHILELSSQDLQQAIANELKDNPAPELVDVPKCRICGTELHGSICPICIQRQKASMRSSEGQSSAYDEVPDVIGQVPDDEEFDPLTRIASE